MSTTDSTTGFLFKEQADGIANLYTYVNDVVNPINDWAKQRMAKSFPPWPNSAARTAQTGMTVNDRGYQTDTDTSYRYNGTAWTVWEKPWTSFTATIANFTGSVAFVTDTAYYMVSAGVCYFTFNRTFAATGTVTVGDVLITLPIASATNGFLTEFTSVGNVVFWDNSAGAAGKMEGQLIWVSTTTARVYRPSTTASGVIAATSSSQPMTWAVSDGLYIRGEYPVG